MTGANMARTEDQRPLWRGAAIEIAAAGRAGAAIEGSVSNNGGSVTRP